MNFMVNIIWKCKWRGNIAFFIFKVLIDIYEISKLLCKLSLFFNNWRISQNKFP